MHILFLTQIIPYPPDAGPKVKTWHVLRYLVGRGHKATLASFVRPEEQQYVPQLENLCAAVHTVPMQRSRLADVRYLARSYLSGRPFLIERDDLLEMRLLVERILKAQPVDVLHADQLTMTQFGLRRGGERLHTPGPALIFDAHNAVWTIARRMGENAAPYLKPLAAAESRRIQRYEGMLVRTYDHTLAVSEVDKQALLEAVGVDGAAPLDSERIRVIPIAVDTQQLQPARRQPGSQNIFTLGTLHYPPNADGIRWFVEQVFPLVRQAVPAATLTIAGKNPPPDFMQFESQSGGAIRVAGYVPDLDPYFDAAAVTVIPVRAGGGMRVRILEAFARGMPVVTTAVGLEGIQALPGEEVLVEDSPADFAAAVIRLLGDPELQAQLAANGRRLAETKYDWQAVLGEMEAVYQEK
jgi:glycosyltransferase involved in cell wall biosynthesis